MSIIEAITHVLPATEMDAGDFFSEVERRRARVALPRQLDTFTVQLSDGASRTFGAGPPVFTIVARDEAGRRALGSFDDLSIAEAFMKGHVDVTGDFYEMLRHRPLLSDRRPLHYLWETYARAGFIGQVAADKRTIPAHYDLPAEFFTLWLDDEIRGYSHAFFESDEEPLALAMKRKFDYAIAATGVKPGDRVLDIGGGWGSLLEYGGRHGLHVTSVTISKESARFMRNLLQKHSLSGQVVEDHFLEFSPRGQRFDAIFNLGVTEHLPDYRRTLSQYERLLVPGRRVYLDCYTGDRFNMSSFVTKWVYQGNTSPCNLARYVSEVDRTDLELRELRDDTHNYHLTCRKWAERLEDARGTISARWGDFLYRRFRLYLWGCARAFADRNLTAHRMVLELHSGVRGRRPLFQF
jgi:cyclopropane-fatty-acyl-phospholipid synthase